MSHAQLPLCRHRSLLVDIDGRAVVDADPRGADADRRSRLSGRLDFGMVAGFKSEWRPASNRNCGRIASEFARGSEHSCPRDLHRPGTGAKSGRSPA